MKKGFRKIEMFVSDHETDMRDYLHLPVVKDGVAIGVVSEVAFEDWVGIKLTLTIWVDIEWEVYSKKPTAIIFG